MWSFWLALFYIAHIYTHNEGISDVRKTHKIIDEMKLGTGHTEIGKMDLAKEIKKNYIKQLKPICNDKSNDNNSETTTIKPN